MEIISMIWIWLLGCCLVLSWRSAWSLSTEDAEDSAFLNNINSIEDGKKGLIKVNIGLLLISFIAIPLLSSFLFLIHQIIIIGIMFANISHIEELNEIEEE